jgi:hypothetical protein
VGAITSVAALSLAIGSAGAFAAPQAAGTSPAPAAHRLSVRPAPHAALQSVRSGQNALLPTPTCNDQWNVVPSGNAGTNANNELNSVSAVSSIDAWAVGDFDTGVSPSIVRQPQAQHWNGSVWSLSAAQPAVAGTGDNVLLSVTAVTTTNVWAVGFSKANNTAGTMRQVLIEHYDGTSWTAIADTTANNPGGTSNSLYGIKFFSATDIWAVGQARTSSTQSTALIVHYDGTSWTIQTPATTSGISVLADVLPLSATDVWAVGLQRAVGGALQTLVEHYNGTGWTAVAAQNPNATGQLFNDIAGVANDLWAVGAQASSGTTNNTLIEHYDGTSWSVVASPTPDLTATLIGVRYAAANDVWAVGGSGYTSPGTNNELDHTVIEHWDGNTWRQVASPNFTNHENLFDVAIASPNLLLTVGFAQDAVGGAASTNLAAALCEPTPAVTALGPDHGNSAGGQVVKIMGSGLAFPRSVTFGTTAATSFSADSDSQITAVAPAGPVGTMVNVTVMTMGGTSATGTGNQYTFFGPGPWELAGGVLASAPAASTWGNGRLDAFVTGTDGIVYHRFFNGTSWAWEGLPGETSMTDTSSISTVSGSIDLFIQGADNALWRRHFSAGAWVPNWERVGGVIIGAPAAISLGSGNIAVFVQGADNHLWLASLSGTTWTWTLVGGVLGSGPAAVSAAPAASDAFVRGTDGALWHWSSVGGATGTWTLAGGRLIGKPAATAGRGLLDVFVEGTDTALWHWSNPGAGPIWELVGGRLAAPPAAVSWGGGRLDALVEGTDTALYHAWSTTPAGTAGAWSWEGLGGKISGSPAAVTWGVNRLDAFVRGTDNHLWHVAFN